MRFPTVVVALISLLCVNVQADKDAIGDEVLFFYYVYKMEFQATGNSGMGGNRCRGKLIKAPCGFSDFVKDVMAKRFRDAYRPASADLTHKPDASNLRQFEAVDTRIPRQYLLNKVIRGQVKRIPNAQLIRQVWTIARHARNTGKVISADMQGARDAAREALASRFYNSRILFNQALLSFLSSEVIFYLASDDDHWYNWKQSLKNIDKACDDGKIDMDTKKKLKNEIKVFSQKIRAPDGAGETARVRLAVLQEYQKGITSIQKWIAHNDAKIFDDTMACKGGITKRSTTEAGVEWLDKGRSMVKRFLDRLPHIGIDATRSILAHRIRSEL